MALEVVVAGSDSAPAPPNVAESEEEASRASAPRPLGLLTQSLWCASPTPVPPPRSREVELAGNSSDGGSLEKLNFKPEFMT